MFKTVIIYASVHHQNTEKVVKFIAPRINADVIDILKTRKPDLGEYERVVLASGIYFNKMHPVLLDYIRNANFSDKKTLVLYTCGMHYKDFAKEAAEILKKQGAEYLGSSYCRGYDTYGPFKLIGGIAKKHPSPKDLENILRTIRQQLD